FRADRLLPGQRISREVIEHFWHYVEYMPVRNRHILNATWRLVAVVFAVIASGCTSDPLIEIWNNTVGPITVLGYDNQQTTIQHGANERIPRPSAGEGFPVKANGVRMTFRIARPPEEFVKRTRSLKTILKVQINADNKVYLLDPL